MTCPVFSSNALISTCGSYPCNSVSTATPTSRCTRHRPISSISTATPNVGGPSRSKTLFCTLRRRASSSPKVTLVTPPTKSFSVGFFNRFSRVCPCAVAIICTPRCDIVRAAAASSSVPISSTTTTSGVWFCTASIKTWCCSLGDGTCMRRALPIPGWGISPSPPISLDVSTITTRRPHSTLNTRDISRIAVVLPTPGRPNSKIETPVCSKSFTKSALPSTARPTRHVNPTTTPDRFRITDTRCSVSFTPARLSPPTSPTPPSADAMSS
mmetsp:Transcript_8006/g.29972  ORF Transcript_8006/g.29972 Transcript_8006/m.29972 type:complete len:269 (+) Transcript_8006:2765-3571(+)